MKKKIETCERLMTIGETAEVLNTSTKTVRRRINLGELAVIRDGRVVRIHPADLRTYIAAHRRS